MNELTGSQLAFVQDYNAFGVSILGIPYSNPVQGVQGLMINPTSKPVSPGSLSSGDTTAQVSLTGGYYQSSNFLAGVSGWQILANGDVEFNAGTFRGALVANSINIPDTTTVNSFHVDSMGNTWWGGTNFAAGVAKISNTGAATFTNVTINGYVLGSKGAFGGDGSDGTLSISSGTTTINCANAKLIIKNYTSISITGTGALAFNNPHPTGTYILFKSQGVPTLTSSATRGIDLRSLGSPGGAAKTGSGTVSPSNIDGNAGTSGSSLFTITGGGAANGTNSISAAGGAISTVALNVNSYDFATGKYPFVFVAGGGGSGSIFNSGGGGTAYSGTTGVGGAGAGAFVLESAGALNFGASFTIDASGSSGTNASARTGILTEVGGGGGGGGGFVGLFYNTLTANAGTINIAGGVGGTGLNSQTAMTGGGGGGAFSAGDSSTTLNGAAGSVGKSMVVQNTAFA